MGPAPMADTAYLKRRRGKNRSGAQWYVRVVVPPDVREAIGKKTIERSLDTSDLKKAQRPAAVWFQECHPPMSVNKSRV